MPDIFTEALKHAPALLATWLVIFAAYWFVGMIRWPRWASVQNKVTTGTEISFEDVGGFRWGSLALISVASLFLELLLIRWVAAELRIFAYFKSLVLIACFLGFGLGCYLTRRPIRFSYLLVPLLALVLLVELPWDPMRKLIFNLAGFIGWFSDVHVWNRAYFSGQEAWGLISAGVALSIVIPLFGLIAITFIPMGQLVGLYLERSRQGILAYSVNVAASVVGIWLFTLLCFQASPPLVWFALAGLGLVIFLWRVPRLRWSVLAVFVVICLLLGLGTFKRQWWGEESWKDSDASEHLLAAGEAKTLWSPYQKLTIIPLREGDEVVRYVLNTNDTWYQQIIDMRPEAVAKRPESYQYADVPIEYHQYNLPYEFYPRPERVLIAGGGMGNDAAAALRHGASAVTVVEIDPIIRQRGRELHFEKPYLAPNVELITDDARSFIQNHNTQYDLVVFSILDSHTTISNYTNIRLDNYVYTVEAMRQAKRLLKEDGLFVMSFSAERPWFTKRLLDAVAEAFERPPLVVQTNVTFFVVGTSDRVAQRLAADPALQKFVTQRSSPVLAETTTKLTDDWPFLYLKERGIPVIVWVLSIGLLAICYLTFRRVGEGQAKINWHFFFLGAAFMLLEVQVISKAALLFGTTWVVNSIVITTLLVFILLANLVTGLFQKLPPIVAYVGLFGTMIASYFVPANQLFHESWLLRGLVATGLYCAPVFFAGLVFISSFRQAGFRAEAFGSNLLGALCGGLLESMGYLVGIQALVLIALGLYVLSLLFMRRLTAGEVATPSSVPAGVPAHSG